MPYFRRITVALSLAVALASATGAPVAMAARTMTAPTPGYLTIQFGRSIWAPADRTCTQVPNSLTLNQVAVDMQSHGFSGTGTVVVNRTQETSRGCLGGNMYSDWADLATLRDTFGWRFVSDGLTHGDMTKMTPTQQQAESCGSLPAFTQHGHTSASGLFAYGNNKLNATIQANVVSKCFSYGRTYQGGVNQRAAMAAPWFQRTNSVLGGNCNAAGLPCSTVVSPPSKKYVSPVALAALVAVQPDQWVDLQFYRLVTGASSGGGPLSWDCTNPDWTFHWTSTNEMYCVNDFDYILGKVPAGVVVTDPATVASAWGRQPG